LSELKNKKGRRVSCGKVQGCGLAGAQAAQELFLGDNQLVVKRPGEHFGQCVRVVLVFGEQVLPLGAGVDHIDASVQLAFDQVAKVTHD